MKQSVVSFLVSFLLISVNAFSQGTDGVLIDPNNATTRDASAVFQAQSTSQGVMIPRMTAAQRGAIPVSAARDGLIVYQTDGTPGFYYYNGTAWVLLANTTSNLAGVTAGTGLTGGGTSGTITVNAVGDNGLTTNADDIDLGGPLTQAATTITQDGSETFTIANTGTGNTTINLTSTGDFDVQDNGTSALFVRDDAFVGVGTNAPNSPFTVRTSVATANARTTSLANAIGDANFELTTSRGATTNASGDVTTQIGQAYNGGTITEGIRFIRGGGSTDGSMAFVTNAGAERMRINSNGNVGIGTTGPESILHIEKNASGAMGGDLVLTNKVNATNTSVAIDFGVDNSTTANGAGNGQIKVINMDGTNQKADMTFSTWNGSAFGERMRIASNGNVGIGSATPGYKLDVVGDTKTSGKFFGHLNVDDTRAANTAPTGYNNEVAFDFKQISVLNSAPGSGTYGGLITMAPWSDNSGDASHQLLFNEGGIYWRQGQPDAAAWDAWSQVLTTSAGGAGTPNYLARWITANSLGIGATYDNGTNVGIGNTAPGHQLSVGSATADGQAVSIRGYSNSPANWKGGGAFGYTSAAVIMGELNAVAQLGGHNATLGAWANLAINSGGGNVGIATTAPAEKLDVTGNIKATGVVYWGNGLTRTETRNDAGTQGGRSGFYENDGTSVTNYYSGASGWQHLLETRHSNTGNNYAMQIAGSFFDQDFWVRKTNNSATTAWSKMLTTSNIGTSAIQNQYSSAQTASFWINGNAQVGSSFTNLNGRLLTSNQGGWQADGVTPQMVISANSASTNRAALIGLDLHNDNTTNNVYAPFLTFSRRSNSTSYNSAFAAIGAQVTGQGSDANWCAGDMIFTTQNSAMNGMGERMRIDQSGRVYILQNQGNDPNFTGLEDPTSAAGRAQLVLSSSYSDLVIASREANDNHGSTLTFASYNPSNAADYRKFVINQGNWGARFGYLDFGFADAGGRTNPHSNINGTDNVITLNGINKRLGVATMSPAYTFDVNGKERIRRGGYTMGANANEGQTEINNAGSGDAYISFHREGVWGAHFGLGSDSWFSTLGWSAGGGYTSMRVGNLDIRGVVNCIGGYCPSNNAIRLTPNLHLNSNAGNAIIINWDNGTTGATQTFRIGNGSGSDVFYVYADGQAFTGNWWRSNGNSGWYSQSYGGGLWMTDGTWLRTYNDKGFYASGGLIVSGTVNTSYGTNATIYANQNNVSGGGLMVSDDGGFFDYNDGPVAFRGSTGLRIISNNTGWLTEFQMTHTDGSNLADRPVRSSNANWGLLGTSGLYWWQAWAGTHATPSMRDIKKDIIPVQGSLNDLVMADIDKLHPYLYRYKIETDEWKEGWEAKYKPGLRMGLILDETPDYIQAQSFQGLDIYSVGVLGIAVGKSNREEIKQIKQSIGLNEQTMNIQDFGSAQLNGQEVYVSFATDFSDKLSNSIPVVTITSNDPSVTLSVVEKSSSGFKVISSSPKSVSFDYIAMAKVKNTMVEAKEEIPAETMKRIKVDQSIKDKVIKYWNEDVPKREEERITMEKEKAIKVQEESKKAVAIPEGIIGPDKTPLHDPKANEANALIRESEKQVHLQAPVYSPANDNIPNNLSSV